MPLLLVVVVLLAGHVIFQEFQKWKGKPEMKNFKNLAIVAAVIVAAGLVFALKHNQAQSSESAPAVAAEAVRTSTEATDGAAETPAALPRMVDLGADKCIPCKMMAPILNEVAEATDGTATIYKLNVDEQQQVAAQYGIRSIPTMILFKDGKEVERIVGVKSKEAVIASINKVQ